MANRFSNDSWALQAPDVAVEQVMNGIVSVSEDLNTSLLQPSSGSAWHELHNVRSQLMEFSLTTESLKGAIDNININGLCLDGEDVAGYSGFTLYKQSHAKCTSIGRTTGSTHSKANVSEGRVILESITGSPGDNATATIRVHAASWDGTTAPIVWTHGSVALPTITAALRNTMWTLNGVTLNNTALTRVRSVTVNYNHSLLKPIEAGQLWPKEVDVTKVGVSITITTDDTTLVQTTIPTAGLAVTHANSFISFRKRTNNGGLADVLSGIHIQGTFAGVAHVRTPYSASGEATGSSVIEISCIDDLTNAPIKWDTAYVIGD